MHTLPRVKTLDDAMELARLLNAQNHRFEKEIRRLAEELAEAKDLSKEALQQRLDAIAEAVEGEANKDAKEGGSASGNGPRKSKSERRRRRRRGRNGETKSRDKDSYGNTTQEALPHEEVLVTLPEDEQKCGECGKPLQEMDGQTEDSETIIAVKRKFIVKQVKRQKYRSTCACKSCTVVTAAKPEEFASLGGRYGVSLAAQVATDKWVRHLPLNRQVKQMASCGLVVTTQTLSHQMWLLAQAAEGTSIAIKEEVLRASVVHIDETSWPALQDRDGVHMLWGMTSSLGAYYAIQDNRSHVGVHAMLGDYAGWVVSDGLEIYKKASKEFGYHLAGCLAHARRKFFKAEPNYPDATQILDRMDELFRIERELDAANATLDEIRARRQTESQAIIDKIRTLRFEFHPKYKAVKTDMGDALNYLEKQWKYLISFVDHPEIPLSNNPAERSLRPAVIGRKNYGGTRSRKGELVTTVLSTVVETARIRGVDPTGYLEAIARKYLQARRMFPRGALSDEEHSRLLIESTLMPDEYRSR